MFLVKVTDQSVTLDEMVAFYKELVDKFPIRSIEDGLTKTIGMVGKN